MCSKRVSTAPVLAHKRMPSRHTSKTKCSSRTERKKAVGYRQRVSRNTSIQTLTDFRCRLIDCVYHEEVIDCYDEGVARILPHRGYKTRTCTLTDRDPLRKGGERSNRRPSSIRCVTKLSKAQQK